MRLLIFILIILPFCAIAQQPFSYKLDYENGFQSNEVYEIQQDSFGFIWIGCDAGIFRYDGVYFKQYTHPKQNGVSISNLIIDKQQRVWCQNFTGQVFYIKNDTIHLFKDFIKKVAFFPKYNIQEDSFLVFLHDYTEVYRIKNKTLESKYLNKDSELKTIFSALNTITFPTEIYIDNRYNIYYKNKTNDYVNLFKTGEYNCHHLRKVNDAPYAILKNNKTQNWIFAKFQNNQIIQSKTFPPETFNDAIYMIKPIRDGFVLCTADGIYLLDAQFNLTNHYFQNEKITDALFDKEGNLWLTSLQNGIYIIPSIDLTIFSADFFPNANITTLTQENNELLLGTYLGNIYKFNPQSTTFQTLPIRVIPSFRTTKKIFINDDLRIFAIGESTVLINKKTNQRRDLILPNIRDMLVFQDTLFSMQVGSFQKTDLTTNKNKEVLIGAGRMITKSPTNDTIFLSNKNGFFRYFNGKTEEIFKNGQSIYPICSVWQQDTLWLGTLSDGFMAYHNGQFLHHFYKKNTAKNILVRSIQIYKNWLILATNIGLIRMDLVTKKMEKIDVNEGLYQKEITGIEVIKDEIFLSTTNSLIRFPLNIQAQNSLIPNIDLHSIVLNDSFPISKKKNHFKYFENNLLFKFQTALFRSRQKFHYEFRLIGLNENWQITNATSPTVQYRSLAAGNYTFEVRAVNEDNIKSTIEKYRFSIALPIWKRWWFVLIAIGILAIFVYWIFMKRLHDIKQKVLLQNELKSSQLIALKAQMNPHFLYNSLNSIQDLILQEDVINANQYLTKFSHLMRQILEASEYIEISLSREIQILELYLSLEKLRFGDKFQYQIQIPKQLNLDSIKVASMIIQPFVENAVKHGLLHKTEGDKQLNINFEMQDLLICTITDNGIGRKESAKIKTRQGNRATSFATSATQKRLNILNQTHRQKIGLEIIDLYKNEEAIGTKVILRIPFSN